jgi:hypothetical protein
MSNIAKEIEALEKKWLEEAEESLRNAKDSKRFGNRADEAAYQAERGAALCHAAELAALRAKVEVASCDMGELCIGCEPRNADGSCPGSGSSAAAPAAPASYRFEEHHGEGGNRYACIYAPDGSVFVDGECGLGPADADKIVDALNAASYAAPAIGGKPTHDCPDWDYMEVRPGEIEMDACTCDFNVTPAALKVDDLAQEIRSIDGRHDMGAGALAEALMPFLAGRAAPAESGWADEIGRNGQPTGYWIRTTAPAAVVDDFAVEQAVAAYLNHPNSGLDRDVVRAMLNAALSGKPSESAAVVDDPIRALIDAHAQIEKENPYAYFELAYSRQTGWMAWITDKPLGVTIANPDRKVLATGQGETPEAACTAALSGKQGGDS